MIDDKYELRLLNAHGANFSYERINVPVPVPPPYRRPPQQIADFLYTRGWIFAAAGDEVCHPEFMHPEMAVMQDYTWEQALAIETFRFINLGLNR